MFTSRYITYNTQHEGGYCVGTEWHCVVNINNTVEPKLYFDAPTNIHKYWWTVTAQQTTVIRTAGVRLAGPPPAWTPPCWSSPAVLLHSSLQRCRTERGPGHCRTVRCHSGSWNCEPSAASASVLSCRNCSSPTVYPVAWVKKYKCFFINYAHRNTVSLLFQTSRPFALIYNSLF